MSQSEDLDMVYQCLKAGADHYMLKPLKEEHLRNLTQSVYRKKHEAEVLLQLNSQMSRAHQYELMSN